MAWLLSVILLSFKMKEPRSSRVFAYGIIFDL